MAELWHLKELADLWGISQATLRNWHRNGSLPIFRNKDIDFPLSNDERLSAQTELMKSHRLKKRVNRSRRSSPLYRGSKVIQDYLQPGISQKELLFNCALWIGENILSHRETKKRWLKELESWGNLPSMEITKDLKAFLSQDQPDCLGLIYQLSLKAKQNIGRGSFFTPWEMVEDLLTPLDSLKGKRFLDPALGSGRFLMYFLLAGGDGSLCQGIERDPLACQIARLNYLYQNTTSTEGIPIIQGNALRTGRKEKWDIIATNPPWGNMGKEGKDYPSPWNQDLFAPFLKLAMERLNPQGKMAFLLPSSLAFQQRFSEIRRELLKHGELQWLKLWDATFPGVQSPPLGILWQKKGKKGWVSIHMEDKNYRRQTESFHEAETPFWDIAMSEKDKALEKKMDFRCGRKLRDLNPTFLLGIVTGHNQERTCRFSKGKKQEMIVGSDISPGQIKPSSLWLNAPWENLQQHGPLSLYQSPIKLVYRFISDRPQCALDDQGRWMLNSVNAILLEDRQFMEFLCLLLNSKLYGYLYKKRFNSLKILKSHLIELPIPDPQGESRDRLDSMLELTSYQEKEKLFQSWLEDYFDITKEDYSFD